MRVIGGVVVAARLEEPGAQPRPPRHGGPLIAALEGNGQGAMVVAVPIAGLGGDPSEEIDLAAAHRIGAQHDGPSRAHVDLDTAGCRSPGVVGPLGDRPAVAVLPAEALQLRARAGPGPRARADSRAGHHDFVHGRVRLAGEAALGRQEGHGRGSESGTGQVEPYAVEGTLIDRPLELADESGVEALPLHGLELRHAARRFRARGVPLPPNRDVQTASDVRETEVRRAQIDLAARRSPAALVVVERAEPERARADRLLGQAGHPDRLRGYRQVDLGPVPTQVEP